MLDSAASNHTRSGPRQLLTAAMCIIFALPITGWLIPGNDDRAVLGRELVFWAMAATIVFYVLNVERKSLTSIGLRRPSLGSVGFGVLGAVVAFAGMACMYVVLLPHIDPSYASKTSALQSLPLALKIAIVLRAAIFEEVFYRGFMIERLNALLGSRTAAAVLSWAAFTAAHVGYWGWGSILLAGFGGAVLTGLYLWRRDLTSNMIAHGLTDAISLLI